MFSPPAPPPLSLSVHFTILQGPAAATGIYPMRRPKVDELFPWKETGHLLFSYSNMKRHFYFCRPLRIAASSLFLPSSKLSREYQCHIRECGSRIRGSSYDLQYGHHVHIFKESLLFLSLFLRSQPFFHFSVFLLLIVLHEIQQVTLNRPRNSHLTANLLLCVSLVLRCDLYLPVHLVHLLSSVRQM